MIRTLRAAIRLVAMAGLVSLSPQALADDYGDTPASATPVAIGSVTAGVLDVSGDLDYFKFTVASTGTYVIYTRGATQTNGTLYDSLIQTVDYDYCAGYGSCGGEQHNFRIERQLLPGTYYLKVSGYASIAGYELHLEGPGAGTVSDDHGFSPWSATPVAIGSVTPGALDISGDLDYFKFTVPATATYVMYSRGGTDTTGTLYDSLIQQIDSNSDSGECAPYLCNFRIERQLAAGTYYLKVSGSTSIAGYTFHLEGPSAGTVSDDHGFGPWSATPVAAGSVTPGTLDASGDLDYFKFTVATTGTYVIYTRGATQTNGTLYDSLIQTVDYDYCAGYGSCGGEQHNFRIERQLLPGTYYLKVSGYASITGYELHLEGPGAGSVSDDHGFSAWSATDASGSCYLYGALDLPGDRDYFRIVVPSTASYVLYTTGTTDTSAVLYNSALQSIGSAYSGGAGTNFRLTQTLSPGTYYLQVSGGYSSAIGQYVLYSEIAGQSASAICQQVPPGGVSVSPAAGSWTTTPHNLYTGSVGATALYYRMVNTYDGSTPPDPAAPTATANDGSVSGPTGVFQYYGAPGLLKRTKLRFVGCNGAGCGPVSPVYSYSIDLRQPLESTIPVRTTPGTTCPAGHCTTASTKAVIITHGWNAAASDWVIEMALAICGKLGAAQQYSNVQPDGKNLVCSASGWDVWVHDWSSRAALLTGDRVTPEGAWRNAVTVGDHLGTYFNGRYQHVHLIAHSAGSQLIDRATPRLKTGGATVHATFLDAYDPSARAAPIGSSYFGRHLSRYGRLADWADSYVDTRVVAFGPLDYTDLHVTYGFNFDVTPSYDGCEDNMAISSTCSHSRPYRFYGESVIPTFVGNAEHSAFDPVDSTLELGSPLSVERGATLASLATTYPDGGECKVEQNCISQPASSVLWSVLAAAINQATIGNSSGAVAYVAGVASTLFDLLRLGGLLPAVGSDSQPVERANGAGPTATTPTDTPSWLTLQVTTTSPVNTLSFNWRFGSAGEGLLRVYVNDAPVWELDQRHVGLASTEPEQVYIGGDSGTLPSGTHKIAFRLDGFGANASGVELTAVQLGLTTVSASAGTAAVLQNVVSRKVHGAAGTFDLALNGVTTNPSTEPRQGPAHLLVFTFDKAVTGGAAAVSEGTATVGTPTFSGNEMRVPLTGVANQQYVTVAVNNVIAADGGTGGSGSIRVGFLAGDVNQSRVVTLADLGQVNAQVAQAVTAANYLKDVNASGTLSLADKGLTNQQLTKALLTP